MILYEIFYISNRSGNEEYLCVCSGGSGVGLEGIEWIKGCL